jgi:hypothetical protein
MFNEQKEQENKQENGKNSPECEGMWDETFKQINELNQKLERLQMKIEQSGQKSPILMKNSHNALKKMNKELGKMLKEIHLQKKFRGNEPNERTKQSDDAKMEFQLKKEMPCTARKRVKPQAELRTANVIVHKAPEKCYNDSDLILSEEIITSGIITPPDRKKSPKAGTIQRNLVIPIEGDSTRVNPEFFIKKCPRSGEMQVDLRLVFENGIFIQNKIVDTVCVKNVLPIRNFRNCQ